MEASFGWQFTITSSTGLFIMPADWEKCQVKLEHVTPTNQNWNTILALWRLWCGAWRKNPEDITQRVSPSVGHRPTGQVLKACLPESDENLNGTRRNHGSALTKTFRHASAIKLRARAPGEKAHTSTKCLRWVDSQKSNFYNWSFQRKKNL